MKKYGQIVRSRTLFNIYWMGMFPLEAWVFQQRALGDNNIYCFCEQLE